MSPGHAHVLQRVAQVVPVFLILPHCVMYAPSSHDELTHGISVTDIPSPASAKLVESTDDKLRLL